MTTFDKLERKYGRYAIRNLPLMLIICYAIGYVIQFLNSGFVNYLTLNPYLILKGQIWRLITWILIPPNQDNFFFVAIMLFFYYSIGSSLEQTWGTFRYNVYILSGMLFTVIGSFVSMAISYLFFSKGIDFNGAAYYFQIGSSCFSTYYVNMSIFLAFAATFPEARVYLFFILPIKVKWMGIVYGLILAYDFVLATGFSYMDVFYRTALISSLLNFFLFFLFMRRSGRISPKQKIRQAQFNREVQKARPVITKHKCAVCGRTEESNPELEFRFCSKCNGNYEYCQDHLFSHTHVQ